jgi:hypothetical protein
MRREKEQARLEEERRKYDEKRHLEWQLWQQQWQMAAIWQQPMAAQPMPWTRAPQAMAQPEQWHGWAPKVFYVQPGRAVVDGFCMPQQQKNINIMSFFHFCQGLAPSKASKASLETVVPVCMTCVFFHWRRWAQR